MEKQIGILCHISSLPSKYGVGDFGKEAYSFVDFLSNSGVKIWQILPLNQTGETNCPYFSNCFFSYDEMFFDVDDLIKRKLISSQDASILLELPKSKKITYKLVKKEKRVIFEKAYSNITKELDTKLDKYLQENTYVFNYAVYKALLERYNLTDWRRLSKSMLDNNSTQYKEFIENNLHSIKKYGFFQYILSEQWKSLKQYANSKGIKILGDIPIYPNVKSFDVYNDRSSYQLDENYNMICTGGVPKNAIDGIEQNWGSCVYDWKKLKETNYEYMIKKFKMSLKNYDILRLDHFYGYAEHYEFSTTNKKDNKWVKAGGVDFFSELSKHVDINGFVAEYIGISKNECDKVMQTFNLTGMCLLQSTMKKKNFLPNNVKENNFYYIGTHDNNTLIGFLNTLDAKQKKQFFKLLNLNCNETNEQTAITIMRQVYHSKAKYVIFQIQDLLMQDEFYRMNIPGEAFGQWNYKMPQDYQAKVAETLALIKQWKT